MNARKTAVLVDGHFFMRRYSALFPDAHQQTGGKIARNLIAGVLYHLRKQNRKAQDLYRIFFYDCPPLEKRVENPVSRRGITMKDTPEAIQRFQMHATLRRQRKVALRLGRLSEETGAWTLKPKNLKPLLKGQIEVSDLREEDVFYEVRQKGVDMKIGLDIASLAYKHLVDQIILIAGDSDFVPAAKLARREGIDFLLDPMWNRVNPDLFEHIDGLQSPWKSRQTGN